MDAPVADLTQLTAADCARRIQTGEITSEMLVTACLDRIAEREKVVQAWTWLDRDYAIAQARRADALQASGVATGPLHGVPIGIKDIIDTEEMPTENGTPLHAGRRPQDDAAVVAALKDAGAVILGKTVTTELAVSHPGKTRNPVNPEHTPGGSSSGSAAAVADDMIPLALGTQTAGSVLRPAAFCGVVGFKPTSGLISRAGVLMQSASLDTVGSFSRTVEDAALICDCLTAYDSRDRAMWPRSRPRLHATAMQEPPVPPLFALVKSPAWQRADATTREAFTELVDVLGEQCDEVDLPDLFVNVATWHRQLQQADIARNFGPLADQAPDQVSDVLKQRIAEGRRVLATEYNAAYDMRDVLNKDIGRIFGRYDAILTPATTGTAPRGLTSTGDPAFCAPWTYLGVPAISLPLLEVDGLPLGVQLVAARRDDGRLLRTARWLMERSPELGG